MTAEAKQIEWKRNTAWHARWVGWVKSEDWPLPAFIIKGEGPIKSEGTRPIFVLIETRWDEADTYHAHDIGRFATLELAQTEAERLVPHRLIPKRNKSGKAKS